MFDFDSLDLGYLSNVIESKRRKLQFNFRDFLKATLGIMSLTVALREQICQKIGRERVKKMDRSEGQT